MKALNFNTFVVALLSIAFWSCEENPVPKPLGFYRIDFPEKEYVSYQGNCPFQFEYPHRSLLDTALRGKPKCWMNLHYPQYAATLHITYSKIGERTLVEFIEDSRKMAMKHIVKADDIQEKLISNSDKRVFGIAYEFEGNTATNYQFFVTDSNEHFLRGSLYFNLVPNADSIEPVAEYIKQDLENLIESFSWKQL
jgi:gliding motility-associated lipoprotein GldD